MKRHWQYLKYVLRHKWHVFCAGFSLRVPLLILIFHDWDKFKSDEWFPYARTFYTPEGEKQYIASVEFAHAWMLHQHRNKHHWQYYLWVQITSHNCAVPLRETDYMVWDSGKVQRVVLRNSGGIEWHELQDPFPGDEVCCPDPMPDVYRREMLADWIGAGRAQGKSNTWEWYEANKDKIMLHPETCEWIEAQLSEMKRRAEAYEKARGMGII
jgi:hypothetical protein